jgi:hypothetical protein
MTGRHANALLAGKAAACVEAQGGMPDVRYDGGRHACARVSRNHDGIPK